MHFRQRFEDLLPGSKPRIRVAAAESTTSDERPMYSGRVWTPEHGYNIAAHVYDNWHWQEFWRRNETPFVIRAVSQGPHRRVVDIGCGSGFYASQFSPNVNVIGVDPSERMLQLARNNTSRHVQLFKGTARRLPFSELHVDLALSLRSLCHEPDLLQASKEIARITKPGGTWIIAEVHAHHAYTRTRIPIGSHDVHIETYKRSIQQIAAVACAGGDWQTEWTEELRWQELRWQPLDRRFASIDTTGTTPVLSVCCLRRTLRP